MRGVGPPDQAARSCLALIYREPEKPTVRACGMRSAVLVTYKPVAPSSRSSAEAMVASLMRSIGPSIERPLHRSDGSVASTSR